MFLNVQGKLVLTNGVTIDGSFGGKWLKRIEIHKGVLEDLTLQQEGELLGFNTKELQYVGLSVNIFSFLHPPMEKLQNTENVVLVIGFFGVTSMSVFV